MAYIIRSPTGDYSGRLKLARALQDRIEASKFRATVHTNEPCYGDIRIKHVRLAEPKPYCGQHPGECFVGPFGERPKRRMHYLEWEDWVEFHALVNKVIDGFGVNVDAWTNPQEKLDKGRKMYVRRADLGARQTFTWVDDWSGGGLRPVQIWNHGTPDQFRSSTEQRDEGT